MRVPLLLTRATIRNPPGGDARADAARVAAVQRHRDRVRCHGRYDSYRRLRHSTAIRPTVLKGELDGLAPLTQYNPHGVFIALEEAGYMLMAAAFLSAGLALSNESRLERALKWILVGGFVTVAVSFVLFLIAYGVDVEYLFEVAAITVDWTVLIVASTLLAILYGRSIERSQG